MCDACAIAKVNARTARFNAGCLECGARHLAHSPDVFNSLQMGVMTKRYQDALQAVFGSGWMEGHQAVKAWAEKINPTKEKP